MIIASGTKSQQMTCHWESWISQGVCLCLAAWR